MSSARERVQKPVASKTLGIVYLLISLLIILVGFMVHMTQTAVFNIESSERIFQQLDLLFFENVCIGFFTGVFLLLGIHYLKEVKKNAQLD